MDLIQTWYDDRYYCTLHFDSSLIDLDHDSRSQGYEKAKPSAPIVSQSFLLIWMEISILLRLIAVMNFLLILTCPFNIQEREPYLHDFVTKKKLQTDFFQNLVWRWRPLSSTFWYQFWWPLPSFKVTVVLEINNLGVHFLANLCIHLDEILYVATTCWFVEAHGKFILKN